VVHDFLHATNEILAGAGVKLPLAGQSTTTPATRMARGLAVQKAIFGEAIDRMREASPADQWHLQDFLSSNCFGDHYTRTGLDLRMRELLTFSMLIALRGCEPQVKGHLQGNRQVGNDRRLLLGTITQLLPYLGYPRVLNALRCLDDILPASEQGGAPTAARPANRTTGLA
jgi:4-carboxymuconolactone decarboxylase